jgi:hypothetical protein
MVETEFVIVLTEHRNLGYVFQPYLIHKKDKFYSTEKVVKPFDADNLEYKFKPYEKELVSIIDKYSDERLMKRFSRAKNETLYRLKIFLKDKEILLLNRSVKTVANNPCIILFKRQLLGQGVPIAGIGVQGHLHAESFDRGELKRSLDSLAQFNLPIKITVDGKTIEVDLKKAERKIEVEF